MKLRYCFSACFLLPLGACASGNVKSVESFNAPPPPHVKHPSSEPYAAYGSVPVVWRPDIANREGTIVNPHDPVDEADRPDYEHANWSIEKKSRKSGTF